MRFRVCGKRAAWCRRRTSAQFRQIASTIVISWGFVKTPPADSHEIPIVAATNSGARRIHRCVLSGILCAEAWVFGLPYYVDLMLFAAAIAMAWRAAIHKSAGLALGMGLALLVLEVAVRVVVEPRVGLAYYSPPAERFADRGRFRANVDETVAMPSGDLPLLDPATMRAIGQPRSIRFRTDGQGLRNDREYRKGDLVLVGDSFVAGLGGDQRDLPCHVLREEQGIEAYSIGLPGGPPQYFEWAERFLKDTDPDARFVFFVFEGNDFASPASLYVSPGIYDRAKLRFARFAHPVLHLPRVVLQVTRGVERRVRTDGRGPVEVRRVGAHDVGFLRDYADASLMSPLPMRAVPETSPVYSRLLAVVFIPTKYRVYSDRIADPHAPPPEPPPGVNALRRHFEPRGVAVVDLTGALKARARELLTRDEYVYWRDDTHWNVEGVRVAMGEVAAAIRAKNER